MCMVIVMVQRIDMMEETIKRGIEKEKDQERTGIHPQETETETVMTNTKVIGTNHNEDPVLVEIVRPRGNTKIETEVPIDGRKRIGMKEGIIRRGRVVVDIGIRNVHLGGKKGNIINVVVGHRLGPGRGAATGIAIGTEIET
jgi:hypothetical protein